MKIHTLATPPANLTFVDLTVESCEIQTHGTAKVRFRTPTSDPLTLVLDFGNLAELPAPGDMVCVSLWRQA